MTLNDPYSYSTPGFKVTLFFDAEYLRNGTGYRHSLNGIQSGLLMRFHRAEMSDALLETLVYLKRNTSVE